MTAVAGASHFQLFTASLRGSVRWRLLSGNNREIGRSVASFADSETTLLAIKEFVGAIEDFTEQVARLDGRGWGWTLKHDNVCVARSSRPYDRQVRCEQALANFRELAQAASLGNGAIVMPTRMWSHAGQGRQPMQLNSGPDLRRTRP